MQKAKKSKTRAKVNKAGPKAKANAAPNFFILMTLANPL